MASVFAEPDNDTLRLRYEDFVKSSETWTFWNKKLLETSASLLVTSALLVVTRSY